MPAMPVISYGPVTMYMSTGGTSAQNTEWTAVGTATSLNYTTGVTYSYHYGSGGAGGVVTYGTPCITYTPIAENREQQAERERRDAERRRRHEAASERARELLASMLTEEQELSWRERGFFEVTGSAGNRYRIRGGQVNNVDRIGPDGLRDFSACAHPPDGLPDADVHLAQMLHLVTDEEAFVRTANLTWRRQLAAV